MNTRKLAIVILVLAVLPIPVVSNLARGFIIGLILQSAVKWIRSN